MQLFELSVSNVLNFNALGLNDFYISGTAEYKLQKHI